jgi:molybdate transport system ATP-binding protein
MHMTLTVHLEQSTPIPLDVQFTCNAGELTALFGPSGSGKTTILRSIAGLYTPAFARIESDGATWTDTQSNINLPPNIRSVGLVFQDYALFPHMTVREQLLAAMSHRPREQRAARVEELLLLVRMESLADRRPASLSGGQQQRVAIARALARDPSMLLLDEPFAHVDRGLRDALQRELVSLRKSLRIPIVLVTHDFDDVARLADHLVMIDVGKVVSKGSVAELTAANALPGVSAYREPGVVMDARISAYDAARRLCAVETGGLTLWLPSISTTVGANVRLQIAAREVILATSRPEGISLQNMVDASVISVASEDHSGLALVTLQAHNARILAQVTHDAVSKLALAPGRAVLALIKAASINAFTDAAPSS